MAHGLEIYGPTGAVKLTITNHLSRILYSATVAEDATGSTVLTLPAGFYVFPVSLFISQVVGEGTGYRSPHIVSLAEDGTLTWSLAAGFTHTGPSKIQVFAYG